MSKETKFRKGDKVTERGVWLEAVMWTPGPQVSELMWVDHIKHGMPGFSFVSNGGIISWEEAQKHLSTHEYTSRLTSQHTPPLAGRAAVCELPPMEVQPTNERELGLSGWYRRGNPEDAPDALMVKGNSNQ